MENTDLNLKYKLVLGLEVHMHLKTASKMFCGCDANIYGTEPNTHTCPTCLGLPGALPVPNKDAVEKTQLLGLALGCTLNKNSRFDRKHYFYPDLPKGYQISQYKQPLCLGGSLTLNSGTVVEFERIHLEEDTAKSVHQGENTLIDFNKSGMPLVEIVTKPIFTSTEDAVEFCKKIQDLVKHLEIADVDMEKGQMRLEANVSLRTPKMETAGELATYKVEIKNINSFKFMEKAVKAEIKRQAEVLAKGETLHQENRGYDEDTDTTVAQRDKEDAHDYRYFPEPDIPPMVFDANYIDGLKKRLPDLPEQVKNNLIVKYKLTANSAQLLSAAENKPLLKKFEEIVELGLDAVKVSNLLLNKNDFKNLSVADFIAKVKETENVSVDAAVVEEAVAKVIAANPDVVASFKNGKVSVLEFLVGQVMRETKGKASADVIRSSLIQKLK